MTFKNRLSSLQAFAIVCIIQSCCSLAHSEVEVITATSEQSSTSRMVEQLRAQESKISAISNSSFAANSDGLRKQVVEGNQLLSSVDKKLIGMDRVLRQMLFEMVPSSNPSLGEARESIFKSILTRYQSLKEARNVLTAKMDQAVHTLTGRRPGDPVAKHGGRQAKVVSAITSGRAQRKYPLTLEAKMNPPVAPKRFLSSEALQFAQAHFPMQGMITRKFRELVKTQLKPAQGASQLRPLAFDKYAPETTQSSFGQTLH